MRSSKTLILFDFDGTITTHDSFLLFIKYYHGLIKFIFGFLLLSPLLVLMKLKLLPNWRVKQIVLTFFFKGADPSKFNSICADFAQNVLPKYIRTGALEEIEKNALQGHCQCVVSASPYNWVNEWCKKHNLMCLATNLQIIDNKLTGKLLGKNCYGPEKVIRIKETFTLSEFEEIISYGDSSGDTEMFSMSTRTFYKPFRKSSE